MPQDYEYQQGAFPRETLNEIAGNLKAYFARKRESSITLREAALMVDFVAGPAPRPQKIEAIDYTKAKVTGGGLIRPSAEELKAITEKQQRRLEEPANAWDAVFDELIENAKKHPGTLRLIYAIFKERESYHIICEEYHISHFTYYRHRRTILESAGVLAQKKGLLNH